MESQFNAKTRKSRAQEVTLARLRIGHTRKTHAYLLAGNPPPYCDGYLVPLSVMHILSECPEYGEERMRHYGAVTVPLCPILADHEPAVLKLFAFLREINWLECTITEKSAVAFSLGGDNLKRYFDQK